jgi:hypothetical protein
MRLAFLAIFASAGALAAQEAKPQDLEPLKVDEKAGTISFGARAAKQDVYEQLKGAIEYLIVMPGGKEYESALVAPIDPAKLDEGMKKLGWKPGKPGSEAEKTPPEGAKLKITVEWKDGDKARKEPAESLIQDVVAKKAMAPGAWIYSGSKEAFDPVSESMKLATASSKNVIALFHNDQTVLVQPQTLAKDPHQFKANKELLPKEGTPVKVTIEAAK